MGKDLQVDPVLKDLIDTTTVDQEMDIKMTDIIVVTKIIVIFAQVHLQWIVITTHPMMAQDGIKVDNIDRGLRFLCL
jgi:hypothetical protein